MVSYSKSYVNAVVDFQVPFSSDLEKTFRAMAEAGRRLRLAQREVLAETQIQGLGCSFPPTVQPSLSHSRSMEEEVWLLIPLRKLDHSVAFPR